MKTMSWVYKSAAKSKNDVVTEKPSILLGRRFGLRSRQVVTLSAALKEASTNGLLKKKKLTVTTKKTLTPTKSKIQSKNDERDGRRSSVLEVTLNRHKSSAKKLAEPAKISAVNVGMLGIMPQLVRNEGGTWNYRYHHCQHYYNRLSYYDSHYHHHNHHHHH